MASGWTEAQPLKLKQDANKACQGIDLAGSAPARSHIAKKLREDLSDREDLLYFRDLFLYSPLNAHDECYLRAGAA